MADSWRLDQSLVILSENLPLNYQNKNSLINNSSDYTTTSLPYIQSLHPKAVQVIIKVPRASVPDFWASQIDDYVDSAKPTNVSLSIGSSKLEASAFSTKIAIAIQLFHIHNESHAIFKKEEYN